MTASTNGRSGRRPGTVNSRDVILTAARELFAAHGYRGATMRAISTRAGVDPGLIRHFFDDKDGLFAAAMDVREEVTGGMLAALEGEPSEVGRRLAAAYLGMWEQPPTAAPLKAMVRSAITDDHVMERLRRYLTIDVLGPASASLPTDDPGLRLALAMSHLLGIAIARHIVESPPLVTSDLEVLIESAAPIVERFLFGELGTATGRMSAPGEHII